MSNKIKVGIIGANGYAGAELARLLINHPSAEIHMISSRSEEGQPISDIYPSFYQNLDLKFAAAEDVCKSCDVVFASVPHGVSEDYAELAVKNGAVFIDLGADFRLSDEADYEKWYGLKYNKKQLHEISCYALPELDRECVKAAKIIGNPGCYPTSVALALMPAIKAGIVELGGIIIDSKSGTTGAGRGLAQNLHYAECNESFAPYKVAAHRHTPEIEQTLSRIAGEKVTITFVPHLLPINRGIISTCYAKLNGEADMASIRGVYEKAYKDEKFVRVLKDGACANLRNVRMSNYCDISLHLDKRTGTLIVVSAIDNMVKGAAGQAIQNMNIKFGFAEDEGLLLIPPAF